MCRGAETPENMLLNPWSNVLHSMDAQDGTNPPSNGNEMSLTIIATVNKNPTSPILLMHRLNGDSSRRRPSRASRRAKADAVYSTDIELQENPGYSSLELEGGNDSELSSAMDRNERKELIKQILLETIDYKNKSDRQGHRHRYGNDQNLAVGQISGAALLLTACALLVF